MYRFVNTIVFVKDIELSRQFYTDVPEMPIEEDLGIIVFFKNRLVLHVIEKQTRGQRVLRFFDPDRHIVEIGEPQDGTTSTDA